MELLHNLNQEGTTIIMVTHDPDQAREVSRNIQIIDGQISDFKIYAPLQTSANDKAMDDSATDSLREQEVVDA
jgi:putative ABC transport system ATP-binding protein